MANTTNGYPYPLPDDPFNASSDLRALARATDAGITAVDSRLDDALTLSNVITFTMPTGWRARSSMNYRRLGPFVILGGFLARDTDLTAGRYVSAFSLPSTLWPATTVAFAAPALTPNTYPIDKQVNLIFNTDGSVDMHVPSTIRFIYVHGVILPRGA